VSRGVHMERVKVERHSATMRLLHWLIVIEGVILGLTGLQMGGVWGIKIFPEGLWSIHVVTGLAWIATSIFLIYYLVVTGEYRWYSVGRIIYGLRFIYSELGAWFSGAHVEEPIRYDKSRGEYVEKVVPSEVIAWWLMVFFGVILMTTGLGMAFKDNFSFFIDFYSMFKAVFGGDGYSISRALHLLSTLFVLGIIIIHAYAVYVYRMIRGIVFGDREEPTL